MGRSFLLIGLAIFCLCSTGCQWFPDDPSDYPIKNCSGFRWIGCVICAVLSLITGLIMGFIGICVIFGCFDFTQSQDERARFVFIELPFAYGVMLLITQCIPSPSCFTQQQRQTATAPSPEGQISYKPPVLPLCFSINERGEIKIKGEAKLATPIGVFAIGADYPLTSEPEFLDVIIRDRRKGAAGTDTVYRVRTGDNELSFVFVGETQIRVHRSKVIIDVSDGVPKSICFGKPTT